MQAYLARTNDLLGNPTTCEKFRIYSNDDDRLKLVVEILKTMKSKRVLLLCPYGRRDHWVTALNHHLKDVYMMYHVLAHDAPADKTAKGTAWSKIV